MKKLQMRLQIMHTLFRKCNENASRNCKYMVIFCE